MGYRIREIDAERNFCQELQVEMINRVLPITEIEQILAAEGVQASRVRKLDLPVMVLVLVGMNLYPHLSIGHVMQKIARGLRFIWPDADYDVPGNSALCYRRYQLGEGQQSWPGYSNIFAALLPHQKQKAHFALA
jgi:hypothetical protein